MKLKLIFLTALVALGLSAQVSLAADFSIRLGQPKTPTSQNNFKLTFVANDTRDDRQITVKCFKKGPSDSGFTQFDTDKVMIPGGNTDVCEVTSSILNANGSYSFYVTAEASSTTLTSSTVVVDYNTSGPETPNSYSKERLNSCDYKIKFKTANDGKTVKVQLFRSDTFSIDVNPGSVLTQQNIGPNQEGFFVNSVPTCGKDYYYALRAVDSSDNVSGIIGDSFTTVTNTTVNTSNGTSGTNTGALALNGGSTQVKDGSVTDGENASTSGDLNASGTPTPTVLGSNTDDKKSSIKWYLVLAVILGYLVSRTLRRKSK